MFKKKSPLPEESRGLFYHTPKLTAYEKEIQDQIFVAFLKTFHLPLQLDFNTTLESALSSVM